jgi:hypothetical protein
MRTLQMATVSDFGSLEIKRLRVDEEISATRYGTEIMDKDLIFRVGDVSNPNQTIRFSVHDGTEYRDAFMVDGNGFVVDDLNMSGPSSGVSARDELVTLGVLKFEHFTDHANVRSGKIVFSLNNGDGDESMINILQMTPEEITVRNRLQVDSEMSCAAFASSTMRIGGTPMSTTIASFEHPMGDSVALVEKGADGRVQFRGDVESPSCVCERLSASHLVCEQVESSSCSTASLLLGGWTLRSDPGGDIRLEGGGSVVVHDVECDALVSESIVANAISGGTVFIPPESGVLFDAGGVVVRCADGVPVLSTPVLSVGRVVAAGLAVESDVIQMNDVQLDTTSGLAVTVHDVQRLLVNDDGIHARTVSADTLRCTHVHTQTQSCATASLASLGAEAISSDLIHAADLSVHRAIMTSVRAGELRAGNTTLTTLQCDDVTLGGHLSAASMEGGSLLAARGVLESLRCPSIACTTLDASTVSCGTAETSLLHSDQVASRLVSCSGLTIDSVSMAVGADGGLHVDSDVTLRSLRASGLTLGASLTLTDGDDAVELAFENGEVTIPSQITANTLSASTSVISEISASSIVLGASMRIADGQLGSTIRVSQDGKHAFSQDARDVAPLATVDVRGDGSLLHMGDGSSSLAVSLTESGFLVSCPQSIRFDCATELPAVVASRTLSAATMHTPDINPHGEVCTIPNVQSTTMRCVDVVADTVSVHRVDAIASSVRSLRVEETVHVPSRFEVRSREDGGALPLCVVEDDRCGVNCEPAANLHVKSNSDFTALFEASTSSLEIAISPLTTVVRTPTLLINTDMLRVANGVSVSSQLCAESVLVDTIRPRQSPLLIDGDVRALHVVSLRTSTESLSVSAMTVARLEGVDVSTRTLTLEELHAADGFGYAGGDLTLGQEEPSARSRLSVFPGAFQAALWLRGVTDTSMVLESDNGVPRLVEFRNRQLETSWMVGMRNLPTEAEDVLGVYHSSQPQALVEFEESGVRVRAGCVVDSLSVASVDLGQGGLAFADDYAMRLVGSSLTLSTPAAGTVNLGDRVTIGSSVRIVPSLTLESELDMSMQKVVNLASPVDDNDAVNLVYLTGLLSGLFSTEKVFTAPVFFAPADDTALRAFGLGLAFTNAAGSVVSDATRIFELLVGEANTDSFRVVKGGAQPVVMMEFSPSGDIDVHSRASFYSDLEIGGATLSADGASLTVQGLNTVVSGSLGVGAAPQYRIHVANVADDDVLVCQTSNQRCRSTLETSDTTGQAMTTFSNTDSLFSTGYHSAFDAFVVASSSDLLQNTHLIIFRQTKQTLFAGDVKLQGDDPLSFTIEEDGQSTMSLDKTGVQLQNFGISFDESDSSVSHQLGGVEIISVLSTGQNIAGGLSVSGGVTTGNTDLAENDLGHFTCSSHTIFPSVETDEITLSDTIGFNVYKDSGDALRFADNGRGHVINYDASEESLSFAFSAVENEASRGALFVSDSPSLRLLKHQVCVNTTAANACLNVSTETGPQLSLINPANSNVSAEMEVNDVGAVFFSSSQRSFNFDGDVYASSGDVHTRYVYLGDASSGRWRIGVESGELVLQLQTSGGGYVTRNVFS